MNGAELQGFVSNISSVKSFFLGIFSINTLPKIFPSKHFLICNYDLNSSPGTHWFCLLKSSDQCLECFDSLGLNIEKKNLLQKYCRSWKVSSLKYNETAVQNQLTSTCGKFVLYFAIHRMHNLDLSFSTLLNEIFEQNTIKNEELVYKFLKEIKDD